MKNIKGLNITILGAVRSGIAAAKLALHHGAVPFVSDFSDKLKTISVLDELNIAYETGGHSDKVYVCDLIVTSPGVPSDSEVIRGAKERGIKVISEIEFASWFCEATIVAITGSNGKTTTTELCTTVINASGKKTYSAGNIGKPFSEIVLEAKEDEFIALELSSFQLDYIETFKPKFAIILNITPDHLDRYENDLKKYAASKLRISENQDTNDYLIFNADDNFLKNKIAKANNHFSFSLNKGNENCAFIENKNFVFRKNNETNIVAPTKALKIKGEHNQYNALAVIAVAKLIGISNNDIQTALSEFPGVEHRLEFVRKINGIDFINDSKATNVDSVWYALRSFENPIRLILGGKDKGNDYEQIKELVKKNVKKIYAIGSSAEKIFNYFNGIVEVEIIDTLENCVTTAFEESKGNEVVLLSPACSSFDMFDNYEHRGKVFKNKVYEL